MDGRVLSDLKVADLRRELEKRHKDKSGVKQVLLDRLREALEEDGHDPQNFRFGRDADTTIDSFDHSCVNGDEADREKLQSAKDHASQDATGLVGLNSPMDDQSEHKKLTDESVPYVVQVGDQEEDLDYDLKTDNSEQTENIPTSSDKTELSGNIESRDNEPMSGKGVKSGPESRRNLWISNLPKTVKAADLKQHFSKVGKVVSATVVMSTRSPGGCFGFLQMGTVEDATNAARKLDGTDFSGYKIGVEATERKPPALAAKPTDRSGISRSKPNSTKVEPKRANARAPIRHFASRNRLSGAAKRNLARRERYRIAANTRREQLTRPYKPPRIVPNLLAYQSLRRASRLLAASRYGMIRQLQQVAAQPVTRSRIPRPPITLSRPTLRYSIDGSFPVRRYPISDRRETRPPTRPSIMVRRPDPRPVSVNERRRHFEQPYYEERPRTVTPVRIPARRSEPTTRHMEQSVRARQMPFMAPVDSRRSIPSYSTPRSYDQPQRYEKSERPSNDSERLFSRPSDPPRPRQEPRSVDRMEYIDRRSGRDLSNGVKHSPVSHDSQFGCTSRYKGPFPQSPLPLRSSPARVGSVSKSFMQPRRDYRDVSRSPPRSRNMALVRPYPEASPQHRMVRTPRERTPLRNSSGSRPKIVDYGHRSEPREDWSTWRGDGPSVHTPSGHTWKPAGHSLVSNYGNRGMGRRYP